MSSNHKIAQSLTSNETIEKEDLNDSFSSDDSDSNSKFASLSNLNSDEETQNLNEKFLKFTNELNGLNSCVNIN